MQKFIELEGIVGAEEKVEEELEGETLMDSDREGLRPQGMNIISFPNKFSLFGCSGQQPPFVVFLPMEVLWSIGAPEEDEGEMEEPEVCAIEQAEFN